MLYFEVCGIYTGQMMGSEETITLYPEMIFPGFPMLGSDKTMLKTGKATTLIIPKVCANRIEELPEGFNIADHNQNIRRAANMSKSSKTENCGYAPKNSSEKLSQQAESDLALLENHSQDLFPGERRQIAWQDVFARLDLKGGSDMNTI